MSILNRSQAAFMFSCKKLFTDSPKGVWMWTFTFADVPANDKAANQEWNWLRGRMVREFGVQGIRVTELHKHHGIHYHCLLNKWLPVQRVRELIYGSGIPFGRNRKLGFGRIHVTRCDGEAAAEYLSKYFRKKYIKEHQVYGGRRWGVIGGFKAVRCGDIAYQSVVADNIRTLFKGNRCGYRQFLLTKSFSLLHGGLENWPPAAIRVVLDSI